jgi:carbonic anhydrase/acetyltransferase-like protein (isoleucine patch superfamily)
MQTAEMSVREDREAHGFLSVTATAALSERGVKIFDPASTLISRYAVLGAETVLYPTVIVEADVHSVVEIAEGCLLYPGCVIQADSGGTVSIGSSVQLGPGGVRLLASGPESSLLIGDDARLTGGCDLSGFCDLGRGAQILGSISARSVRLSGGLGGYRWPVPSERGAVLKGSGIADNVVLGRGEVKSRRPSFADAPLEHQSTYHPDPPT